MSPASKAKRKFSLDCPASDMPRNPIKAEYWQVSHGITRMFGNAEDKAPFAGALQLITTSLDYDLGAFWVVNDLRMTLDCAEYFSRSPETFPNLRRSRGPGISQSVKAFREQCGARAKCSISLPLLVRKTFLDFQSPNRKACEPGSVSRSTPARLCSE